MKRKIPIGLSDFRTMIEGDYYYVDKSLLIKEIADHGASSLLLPRPRRFGKTLNLTMLRYFFEKSDTPAEHLFQDLAIWQQGDAYKSLQGRFPVIFLTFKDVKSDSWDYCYDMFKKLIGKEYERHRYLLNNDKISDSAKRKYNAIMNGEASEADYAMGVRELSEHLHMCHNAKTVILIDEYDTPVHCGYLDGFYKEVIGFIRNMLGGALKDNPYLEKGVVTGILRVAKESVFSGLNNLEVHSLLSPEFSTHFGLLEHEVEDMLRYYEIGFEMDEVRKWYNGYVFGAHTVYNPWSILNYTSKWKEGFLPYWIHTSSNDLIRSIITRSGPEVKEGLELLFAGENVTRIVDDNVVFDQFETNADAVWSFLLFCGYLKAVSTELREGRQFAALEIPNAEVRSLFEDIVLGWLQNHIRGDRLQAMLRALTTGDMDTFEAMFQDFVFKSFSMFDTSGTEPENVYHAFTLGLLVGLQETYEVKSNRESGFGRYDVMLIPKDKRNKGIVIEFKKANDRKNETLEQAAERALLQIEQRRYAEELVGRGITDILHLGVAFRGKEVLIRTRHEEKGVVPDDEG